LKKFGNIRSVWIVTLRLIVGVYWLYFSSQKWFDYSWVKPVLDLAAVDNPIPAFRSILMEFVIPNWQTLTGSQTVMEAVIGVLLLLGLLTRVAGILGAVLATGLLAVFLGSLDAPVFIWFYILSALMSLSVALLDAGKTLGADRILAAKWPKPRIPVW
jgi:uncharacterized membrane protein YphA (DoxX/SURF4 family)